MTLNVILLFLDIPLANTLSEIPRFIKEILNLANSGIINHENYLFKQY